MPGKKNQCPVISKRTGTQCTKPRARDGNGKLLKRCKAHHGKKGYSTVAQGASSVSTVVERVAKRYVGNTAGATDLSKIIKKYLDSRQPFPKDNMQLVILMAIENMKNLGLEVKQHNEVLINEIDVYVEKKINELQKEKKEIKINLVEGVLTKDDDDIWSEIKNFEDLESVLKSNPKIAKKILGGGTDFLITFDVSKVKNEDRAKIRKLFSDLEKQFGNPPPLKTQISKPETVPGNRRILRGDMTFGDSSSDEE